MSEAPTRHLGDVASFVRGITFKPGDVVPVGSPGSVACMRTKNVQSELDLSDVWGIPESFVKRADRYLLTGDLLVSSANSWNLVGKCCRVPQLQWAATFGGFISVLRGDPSQIEARYLYHWFSSPRIQATVRSLGQQTTNISNLNIDRCLRLWLPLPPLAEQKRIAGILDAADALRAKRRQALGELHTLLQSTFLDMFGDPVTNPMGCERKPLGEVIRVRSGDGLVSKDMVPDGRYPVYGGNGISGYHDSFMFEEPRIVLGRVGVYCGAVHLTRPRAWVTDNALYVHTFIQPVDTIYVVAALKMANLNQYAGRSAQPLISGNRIYPVEILIPPLDLQHRFAAIVESVEHQKASQRAHLAELDTLFASLQSRAFRGDL